MRERFSNEDGVALILALYLTAALSVVGAGLMFLSQVETYSSANYRVMSQARYGAEAGVYKAAHYLLTAYTPPSTSNATDPLAAYDMSRSPVQYQGRPVVLSTIRGTASNYPSTAVTTAFLNTAAGSLDLYPGSVAYTASATMVAMRQVNGQTVITWQITADGIVAGARPATVEVTATLEKQVVRATGNAYAVFATADTCGALSWNKSSSDSFDSSNPYAPAKHDDDDDDDDDHDHDGDDDHDDDDDDHDHDDHDEDDDDDRSRSVSRSSGRGGEGSDEGDDSRGHDRDDDDDDHDGDDDDDESRDGKPVISDSDGNVGTNGNLSANNSSVINGTLSTPRTGVGNCSSGGVSAQTTNGGATVTGGLVHLSQQVTMATPALTGTLPDPKQKIKVTDKSGCPSGVKGCAKGSSGQLTFSSGSAIEPAAYGDIQLTSGASLHLQAGVYNINSLKVDNASQIIVDSGPVTINIVGAQDSNPFQLNSSTIQGGSDSTKWDPSQLTINYAGKDDFKLDNDAVLVGRINAPNARLMINKSEVYGSVVGRTVDLNNSAKIHYDRKLGTAAPSTYTVGADMLTSFSWKKY